MSITFMRNKSNLSIAFVWYFDKADKVYDNWRDGLRSAIELLEKKHQVEWVIGQILPEDKFDVILFWDDSNSKFFDHIDKYKGKKGLFLTTTPTNFNNLRQLDVVYCESEPVYKMVRAQGIHAVRAFGTDTDFFTPDEREKDIEYFYPATFSPWKLQRNIAHLGKDLTCIGTVQPDGYEDWNECVHRGVNVKVGYFPAEQILEYYRRSKRVVIPAIHGSERTVLEAMSCGIKPDVINPLNIKTMSYMIEFEKSGLTPREFVVKNYSHHKYAEDILRGLK